MHVAGGVERDGLYHDTTPHAMPDAVLGLLSATSAPASTPRRALLERDDDYPPDAELAAELAAIRAVHAFLA
ncbi:hypothetical protein GCM10018954_078230 [Kutzneria kofuensis]